MDIVDIDLPRVDVLPRASRTYLDARVAEGAIEVGDENYNDYLRALAFPEKSFGRVQMLVGELNRFSVTAETAKHPQVRKGYDVLQNFVENIKPQLDANGVSLYLYGSMRFDDPQHLDYDLVAARTAESPNLMQLTEDWQHILNQQWVGIGDEGHISGFTLDNFRKVCQRINNENDYIEDRAFWIDLEATNTCNVLIGNPIFADESTVDAYRNEILDLASKTPLMAALMDSVLSGTLKDRQERRMAKE